jgi:carbon storage regulator
MKDTRKGMLSLNRRPGEAVDVSGPCRVRVLEVRGNQVKLGFEADRSVIVDREEITERKAAEKRGEPNGNVDNRTPCTCRGSCDIDLGHHPGTNHYCARLRAQGERG